MCLGAAARRRLSLALLSRPGSESCPLWTYQLTTHAAVLEHDQAQPGNLRAGATATARRGPRIKPERVLRVDQFITNSKHKRDVTQVPKLVRRAPPGRTGGEDFARMPSLPESIRGVIGRKRTLRKKEPVEKGKG